MGLVFANTGLDLLAVLLFVCYIFYKSYTRKYDYWKRKGVPHQTPRFPFGSMKKNVTGNESWCVAYDNVYNEFKGERFCGVYELFRPILVIRDPELVKQIMVSDFNHFMDRNAFEVGPHDTINHHLFLLEGEEWRTMRRTFSPAFSSGKIKNMFHIMVECSKQIEPFLEQVTNSENLVNAKDVLSRFTMDIIANCAFGTEIYSLKDKDSEFYKTGRSIFQFTKSSLMRHVTITLFPNFAALFNIQRIKKKVRDTLTNMIKETVEYREANQISRQDFLDILIKLRNKKTILDGTEEEEYQVKEGSKSDGLTIGEMTAQSFIFFIAGFETSSSTMTFCLYELARQQDIQARLCEEVLQGLQKTGGEITYDALQNMQYLDQVVNEAMRLYPSLGVLHRRCTSPYKIPDSDLVLEKGQKVYIPIYSIHRDPQYYPDPNTFNPEHFSPENVKNRPAHLHLPFGSGPRHCIGMRFGLMQVKVGIATVVSKFKIDLSPETNVPVGYLNLGIVTQPNLPVLLKFTKRN